MCRSDSIGGSGAYSYTWNSGSSVYFSGAMTCGLVADTNFYRIMISDSISGCSVMDSILIIEPNALTASINATGVACVGDSTGIATVTVQGGVLPILINGEMERRDKIRQQ